MTDSRREILKKIGTATVWITPVVQSVILPAHAQCSNCTTEQPTSCVGTDFQLTFSPSSSVIVGDIVGFSIRSLTPRCVTENVDVSFSVIDNTGAFIAGSLDQDSLDSTGLLTREFTIQQSYVDEVGAVGVEISVRISSTGELINSNTWLFTL